jgi:hypothetical protein
VTESSAILDDLKGVRAYTPERDPVRLFTKNTAQEANQNAQSELAGSSIAHTSAVSASQMQAQPIRIFGAGGSQDSTAPKGFGAPGSGQENPFYGTNDNGSLRGADQLIVQDLQQKTASTDNARNDQQDNLGNAMGNDQFDAMEFTFRLSSAKPLNNPFIVIVTRFRETGMQPGFIRSHIFAESLDPIGPKPKELDILAGGLPLAFTLVDYQVHLYNLGEEVGTNVAADRVALTADEAFEFVKMDYIETHKQATLPPAPMMGKLPEDLPERLRLGQYTHTYYIRVSKDGTPRDIYLDGTCTTKTGDTYLEMLAGRIRFNPALKAGVPVDGTAAVDLRKLAI